MVIYYNPLQRIDPTGITLWPIPIKYNLCTRQMLAVKNTTNQIKLVNSPTSLDMTYIYPI